ncbi:hypothetical protein OESDEN_23068 [Oesophagostomum dentatum]|uniref:Uncharacterized protein n=1 Tax=Oesophagostomum dentatum TaxID=61180 RepID=A0A0B1S1D1_OESDE|nr:hypothetical protein OESDEN_23068 [Oesophagostomum dentatum]
MYKVASALRKSVFLKKSFMTIRPCSSVLVLFALTIGSLAQKAKEYGEEWPACKSTSDYEATPRSDRKGIADAILSKARHHSMKYNCTLEELAYHSINNPRLFVAQKRNIDVDLLLFATLKHPGRSISGIAKKAVKKWDMEGEMQKVSRV